MSKTNSLMTSTPDLKQIKMINKQSMQIWNNAFKTEENDSGNFTG